MVETIFDLNISLLIQSDLSIRDISDIMGIKPTKSFEKGVPVSKQINIIPSHNTWVYSERHNNALEISSFVADFFKQNGSLISKATEFFSQQTIIRISIVSEYAQLGFALTNDIIKLLYDRHLTIEFSILSFGDAP